MVFLQNARLSLQSTISKNYENIYCELGQQKCKENIKKYKKFPKYELYQFTTKLLQELFNILGRGIKTRFCIFIPLLSYLFINYIPDVLEGG